MYNLSTVIKFEIMRTIKRKSFWIVVASFPIILALVATVIFFSNKSTGQAIQDVQNESFSIGYTDKSNLIDSDLTDKLSAKPISDKASGVSQVQSGSLDAYIYYPSSISSQQVEVYGQDVGIFKNSRYNAVATTLLTESVSSTVDDDIKQVLGGNVDFDSTTYRNGEVSDAIKELIAPGIFLVLFYFLIAVFANQMLNSTIEEKENRVIEMLLTTIEARTLIIGKIISLVLLGFIQGTLILLPGLIGYFALGSQLSLPSIDLSSIPLDPERILIGFIIFSISFIMFTGLLVAIGAAVPTAKEAGQFFGIVMTFIFGPLYAAPLFISAPDSPVVQTLTYFPLTAPIPLMLRNAVGNLSLMEAIIGTVILLITTAVIIRMAVRIFQFGALEYSRKLSLKEIFGRKA